MTNKTFTIFDWLKEITTTKKPWSSFNDDEQKIFSSYMINRYISMYEPYVEVANYAQLIPSNDKEKIYKFYCDMLPKKNVFLKYVKSSRKKPNEVLLHHIANYYTISLGEAEDYIYILKKEGVEMILEKSGVDSKEIKKLLKEIQ